VGEGAGGGTACVRIARQPQESLRLPRCCSAA
jgi:hypothetical protein